MRILLCLAALCFVVGFPQKPVKPTEPQNASHRYMTPNGTGAKNGTSLDNAYSAASGGLQSAWDRLEPGETLWVASGEYTGGSLILKTGGLAGKPKILCGKDTGGGLPIFRSDFDRSRPAATGATFVNAQAGASHWQIKNIKLVGYQIGIASGEGNHRAVRIENLSVSNCREGITLNGGGGVAESSVGGEPNIEIVACRLTNYTKRGIRLRNGNSNVRIVRCHADAGGKDWATEPFQMGFAVQGGAVPDHHITFVECTARNNYDNQNNNPRKYWNADGFVAESGTHHLVYQRCAAYNNTDGGWDDKSTDSVLRDCIAVGNKRNYRFWRSATLTNCVAAYAKKVGGIGGSSGLWSSGTVTAEFCTFYANPIGIETDNMGKATFKSCIVATDGSTNQKIVPAESNAVTFDASIVWDAASGADKDPQLMSPKPDWQGADTAFDSRQNGTIRGYHSSRVGNGLL